MAAAPTTFIERPHIVLLGAGASRAAELAGGVHGGALPLMDDLVAITGIGPDLDRLGVQHADRNFEELYTELADDPQLQPHLGRLEGRIRDYFSALGLTDRPTLYDHLVLSLRAKDVIATFNWDPLLFDACARNWRRTDLPHVLYLHGNVRVGYCEADRRQGPFHSPCGNCGTPFTAAPLLFPIAHKDYATDPYINTAWELLRKVLPYAYIITIFGYGGPASDAEALVLMGEAWGDPETRELEQTEIIDVQGEDALRRKWDEFICSHHYQTATDFYDSLIGRHPRRTCEAVWNQTMEMIEEPRNAIPRDLDFPGFYEWHAKLVQHEAESRVNT